MLNNQRVNKSIKVRTLPSFIIIFPGLIDSDAKTKVSLFEKISSLYNGTVIIIFSGELSYHRQSSFLFRVLIQTPKTKL